MQARNNAIKDPTNSACGKFMFSKAAFICSGNEDAAEMSDASVVFANIARLVMTPPVAMITRPTTILRKVSGDFSFDEI